MRLILCADGVGASDDPALHRNETKISHILIDKVLDITEVNDKPCRHRHRQRTMNIFIFVHA